MRIVLRWLKNVTFYLDDIYMYDETFESHLAALEQVLVRLDQHGLTVKPSKCRFGFPTINDLGFVVGNNEVRPQLDKVSAILNTPCPETKKSLCSFLGLASPYRKFMPNAATITASLTDKLKSVRPNNYIWSAQSYLNFETIIRALTASSVPKLPDVSKKFVPCTDASGTGIGAVLLQYHDNTPHPVAYASRKLLDRETRYTTVERELLAVVWDVHRFKYYLLGASFLLEVDHKPLAYLNKFKGDNARLMRWALGLQAFNFQIVHINGRDNVGANFLSHCIA